MSTQQATPFRVPVGTPGAAGRPGAPAGAPAPARNSLAFLGTRNGQLAAAAGVVVAFALYRRMNKNANADPAAAGAAGSSASSGTASGVQGIGNTTASDVYNSLEPLLEQLSGYNNAGTLAAIQAQLAAALAKTGGTTTPPNSPPGTKQTSPGGPVGWATQVHAVGKVGSSYDLASYIKQLMPGITPTQLQAAEYATIVNPANAKYGLGATGKIAGGDRVTFVLPTGKPAT